MLHHQVKENSTVIVQGTPNFQSVNKAEDIKKEESQDKEIEEKDVKLAIVEDPTTDDATRQPTTEHVEVDNHHQKD